MKCKKSKFASKSIAEARIKEIADNYRDKYGNKRKKAKLPSACYQCRHCGHYHLTSQDKSK
jgi:hypothetical protein